MSERVVGKGARSPGCTDFICVPLFLGILALIVALFFVWVGNGAEGFPADRLHSVVYVNGTVSQVASASVLSAFYGMLFDYGLRNGMGGFEHDYLDYNYLSTPYLRATHGAASKWLAGIDAAALRRELPVHQPVSCRVPCLRTAPHLPPWTI